MLQPVSESEIIIDQHGRLRTDHALVVVDLHHV